MITDQILYYAERFPNRAALIASHRAVTYSELGKQIKKISLAILHKRNHSPVRAGLLLPNSIEYIECFLGVAHSANICAPLDPKWTDKQLNDIISYSKIDVIITCRDWCERIDRKSFNGEIVITDDDNGTFGMPDDISPRTHIDGKYKDFYLGFTSGTTGLPKGFLRHQQSWIDSIKASQKYFSIKENEIVAAPGPMVHSLSLYAAVHALNVGASFFVSESFDARHFIKDMKRYKIATIFVVPTMLESLLSYPEELKSHHLSKIMSSGDKLSVKTVQALKNLLPDTRLYEYYGASETSFMTLYDHQKYTKMSSVGRPFDLVDISVRNEEGLEMPSGQIGTIFINSPMAFSGYDGEPQQRDKWITVGDLGYIDEDGFIFLVGRKKNMIITGGLNVYPEEVEACIKKIPNIKNVAVLGLPDQYWGEKIVAVLLEKETREMTDKFLEKHCRSYLPNYKCPKSWVRLDEFPLTSSGKVARNRLKDLLMNQDGVLL
ncbi:AMP-binding protein [Scopulibacillus cellulosilyticus]|uniref:AMP-binding protein n=1 Tax=Scopulibacillus cellulosilyticus TaxID=2665665 RepID=A0ABW2PU73_9BACL